MCIIDQTWPYGNNPWHQPYENPYHPWNHPLAPISLEEVERLLKGLEESLKNHQNSQKPLKNVPQKTKLAVDREEEQDYLLYLGWLDRWVRNEQSFLKEMSVKGLFISNLARIDYLAENLRSFSDFTLKLKDSLV